ncbi:thiamine pyrophosphate-dependent enzyme [Candidatus Hecatella orcuttiae]|jgi:pyruvate ferredoxin oxidoreductase beta subunit|uniref:thiamine pyrophosphate-dependent enzyme n=1 Tax=Candidatus Hecatella orcuttiae TaxID=1935119 RepID=UPI002867D96B|nr:thiamine pyrophosphate-dependent enzyme [Candidatus Hecatella orcuttiae]
MVKLKELPEEEPLAPGHRLCAGCGASMAARMALKAARGPTIVTESTGCLEVATTIYPYTSWRIPWLHTAFENTAAVASGIEAALKVLEKKGKAKKADIIAFSGDGGTFDIGLQALSGALERGHDFVYICYDNEAYMNTGIQRSGATPKAAWTTTTPVGSVIPGKLQLKKDLIGICVAHGIEYAATASVAYWNDYMTKVRKALEVEGPAVIHVFAPCPRGWRSDMAQSVTVARLAVQSRYFPIYEVEKGKYKLNLPVPKPIPVSEYLKAQGRFRHLFKPENKPLLEEIQRIVDENWQRILRLCGENAS